MEVRFAWYLQHPSKERTTIYVRFYYRGKSVKYSPGIKVITKNWLIKKQRHKNNTAVNNAMHEIERALLKIIAAGGVITSALIQRKMIGGNSSELFEVFKKFQRQREPLMRGNTLKKYHTTYKHLNEFDPNLTFYDITPEWAERFAAWLIEEKKMNNNSVGKYLAVVKAFLKWSEGEYHSNVKYRKIRIENKRAVIIRLTLKELGKLMRVELDESLHLERNAFLLRCLTGLRFSDLETLRPEMVRDGYLMKHTVKTGRHIKVPLHPLAIEIIETGAFRVVSNQESNRAIKRICEKAGIKSKVILESRQGSRVISETFEKWQVVSTHTARKTFACLSYEAGMRPENIAEIMGINMNTLSSYLEVAGRVAAEDMREKWGKLVI